MLVEYDPIILELDQNPDATFNKQVKVYSKANATTQHSLLIQLIIRLQSSR